MKNIQKQKKYKQITNINRNILSLIAAETLYII